MSIRWMPLLAATALLSGCSIFSSDSKVKPAELTPIRATADVTVLWHASVGKAGEYVFTPAVVDESVFAASADGTVARFDHGREVWRIAAGEKLSGGVGTDGQLVAVGTPKGEVLTFDAETGKSLWRSRVSSEVLAAPAVGGGLVVVRSGDARIAGLDAKDGKRRWLYERNLPALTLRTQVGVLLGQTVVVAGFPGGKLVAINNQSGASIWEVAVAQPKGATELERIADLSSPPVVWGKEICAAAYQGRVACFDIGSGNMIWGRDVSSSAGIDADAQHLFLSDDRGALHAFDRESGSSLWKQDKLFMRRLSRPLVIDRRVATADLQGVVHFVDRDNGEFVARVATDGSAVVGDPQRYGDGLVVQTKDGGLYALAIH